MLQVRYARYTPHDAYLRLTNEHYILDVDRRSGVIKGLYLTEDAQGTNFFGNEQNMRLNIWWKQRHVPEKAQTHSDALLDWRRCAKSASRR